MALAALCGDDESGRTWADVLQYRFSGGGELHDHAIGNLLIVGLWERLGDPVAGLDMVARLLGAEGRVLPMAAVPLEIEAGVIGDDPARPDEVSRGPRPGEVATTAGRVVDVALTPPTRRPARSRSRWCSEADWVVLGPGSWFTSVIPHLLVPELAQALQQHGRPAAADPEPGGAGGRDRRVLAARPTSSCWPSTPRSCGSTSVLADAGRVPDIASLRRTAESLGAELVVADIAARDGSAPAARSAPAGLRVPASIL